MKDNKLLAEYYFGSLFKWVKPLWFVTVIFNTWEPRRDWNLLMNIVEKIEETDLYMSMIINDKDCTINILDEYGDVIRQIIKIEDTKIESVYAACVEYIKSK